jgi:hypothetical protein
MSVEHYHVPEQTNVLRLSGPKEKSIVDYYELKRDDILVELDTIDGEGIYYDDPDKDDIHFIRFTVWRKIEGDSGYDPVSGASYCTMVADTGTELEWHSMAEHIMNQVHPALHNKPEANIKRMCQNLSWTDSDKW